MASLGDVRAIAVGLPRTSEHLIREHVKFRVGRLVYASMGFMALAAALSALRAGSARTTR